MPHDGIHLEPTRCSGARLLSAPNTTLAERYAPLLVRGECFMTVGLSQLTTSRQRPGQALIAEPIKDGYRLTGEIPWVTGADQADAVVIGAKTPDGLQVMFLLPSGEPGVFVRPPMELAALKSSRTSSIRMDQVVLKAEWLLNGPVEQVITGGSAGGLETSALALGHAAGAIADLQMEASTRPELQSVADEFTTNHRTLRDRLHGLSFAQPTQEDVVNIRVESTGFALRASQAALTAAKGTGFVAPHPAQRRARQALFFLVWSCPRPAAEGLLAELSEG